nr:hypothetical protein 17 [bacterium]
MPWQYSSENQGYADADGFPISSSSDKDDSKLTRQDLQLLCWDKFHKNPHINTSVRGLIGRMTGQGFATLSDIQEIQDVVDETELDYRNRLYDYWPKFVGRALIEGELHLCFTCHKDGFIEVDFVDPNVINGDATDDGSGIIFHPRKTRMPLVYCIKDEDNDIEEQVPSVYLARYPELISVARDHKAFRATYLKNSRTRKKAFRKLGGFYRFIVSWDRGFITKRNISHLRTVLEWLSFWENLKRYEIDHKKSAGAYVWVVKFNDVKSWITWLQLSDEDRAKTGIAAKKTPGGTMVLGPNMEMQAMNPNLPKISEGDSDIMTMIQSGLNEPEDVSSGKARGPFASVKASRGPMSDRVSDEICYFERWLRYDFWGNIFFLRSAINGFKKLFTVREAVDFKNKKAVFKNVKKAPERCLEICFPVSSIEDIEAQAKTLLGVKHGSLYDTAGIPNAELVKRLGFRGYRKLRLQQATEEDRFPDLVSTVDAESLQEAKEAEPSRSPQK